MFYQGKEQFTGPQHCSFDITKWLPESYLQICQFWFGCKVFIVWHRIVGFNIPLNSLYIILGMILHVRWPNQQHHGTEGWWLSIQHHEDRRHRGTWKTNS